MKKAFQASVNKIVKNKSFYLYKCNNLLSNNYIWFSIRYSCWCHILLFFVLLCAYVCVCGECIWREMDLQIFLSWSRKVTVYVHLQLFFLFFFWSVNSICVFNQITNINSFQTNAEFIVCKRKSILVAETNTRECD